MGSTTSKDVSKGYPSYAAYTPLDFELVCESLKTNQTLKSLDIGARCLKCRSDLKLLTDVLISGNHALTKLYIMGISISTEGAQLLSDVLKKNKTITLLNICHDDICNPGAQFLGEALEENQTLTSLDISENDINYSGSYFLFKALLKNRTLTDLNFRSNTIGDSGAIHLGQILKMNQVLSTIDVRYNDIGFQGTVHLYNGLKNNYSITSLQHSGRRDNIFVDKITDEVRYNKFGNKKLRYNIGRLLLYCHHFEHESLLYKDNLPLDIFKVIFKMSDAWYVPPFFDKN